MADHGESEQPRKRVRLTEPDEQQGKDVAAPASNDRVLEDHVKAQLEQESKFGITVFASTSTSFSCIVKQRYTDFLVNEILLSGEVLHLESLGEPKKQSTSNGHTAAPVEAKQETVPETKTEAPQESSVEKIEGPQETSADSKDVPAQPTEETAQVPGMHPSRAAAVKAEEDEGESTEQRKEAAIATIAEEDMKTIVGIFGEKTANSILQLYGKVVARPDRKGNTFPSFLSEPIEDKQDRTNAHVAVRRVFKERIETVTDQDNCIAIKAIPAKNNNKGRNNGPLRGEGPRVKGKVGWDELGGEHLHFTLYKENKDTMEVLFFLASQMKLAMKNFQMAGTKDRRGVTVQRVSMFRTTKEKMESFNPKLRQSRISGFKYEKQGLELGDLKGNEFTITLRDCQVSGLQGLEFSDKLDKVRSSISTAMADFEKLGFINYYGLQRFGSFAISTDKIGKLMLQGDLKGAVDAILDFSPTALAASQNPSEDSKISSDDKARAEALDIWKRTQKAGQALEMLPRKFQAESAIIKYLGWVDRKSQTQKRSGDYHGALSQIARNLRLMYVHAYQSLVWNAAAAKRLETYGHSVVEGDLIMVKEHQEGESAALPLEDVDDEGEVIIRPSIDDSAAALDDKFERARPVTKEEAETGKFTMFDLVLPQPGFDVVYPKNAIGDFYKEFMAKDNLDPHDMRRKWKDVSLSGSYRKMMSRPENVSYEVKTYIKDEEQLVQTDLERLQAAQAGQPHAQVEQSTANVDQEMTTGEPKIALVLKMQLGSSQYATMALRELTKGAALSFRPDFSGR